MRILTFRICENTGADQLHSNCKADQRICFRYMDIIVKNVNPKFAASSHGYRYNRVKIFLVVLKIHGKNTNTKTSNYQNIVIYN